MSATKWNKRYQTITELPQPCYGLVSYAHLLPITGTALDLACGLGANALFLAHHGLETYAWDYAQIALEHLQVYAQIQQVQIHTEVRDVMAMPPSPNSYDVIVVCHFLERNLARSLIEALKPNGLLFYQTFTHTYVNNYGPKNPDFRLSNNELLRLFADLQIVIYCEEGNIGDNTTQGFRDEALLVARKAI
jgi:tellurite methyltransferase